MSFKTKCLMPEGKHDPSDRIRETSYLAYPELLGGKTKNHSE